MSRFISEYADNREFGLKAANGNKDAAAFLELIVDILHFWDDLIDKDNEITDEYIHKAMWKALVDLPRNAFYSRNFSELNPVLVVAISNWIAANDMEAAGQESDLDIAFIIRSSYVDLITHTATLCGGFEHGRNVALEVRRKTHSEGSQGYRDNLAKQMRDAASRAAH